MEGYYRSVGVSSDFNGKVVETSESSIGGPPFSGTVCPSIQRRDKQRMNRDNSKTKSESKPHQGGEALTVAALCEPSGPVSQSARVLASLGSSTPLLFAVTGVLTPSDTTSVRYSTSMPVRPMRVAWSL